MMTTIVRFFIVILVSILIGVVSAHLFSEPAIAALFSLVVGFIVGVAMAPWVCEHL